MSVVIEVGDEHNLVNGYPKLAQRMGQIPETAIFRRFGPLSAQNLLYIQAELTHLERRLRKLELDSSKSEHDEPKKYALDWAWLALSQTDRTQEQWQIVLAIRRLLKEYNEAVLLQASMAGLPEPDSYDLKDLQKWLQDPKMGNRVLEGADAKTWGEVGSPCRYSDDLIVLRPRQKVDPFSRWILNKCIVWLHHRILRPLHILEGDIDQETGIATYNEDKLLQWSAFIGCLLASLLPVVAIGILYCVESVPRRIGIIAVFNLVFCICLSQFTIARRVEMFAAAAAFAAVQVVFVGTNEVRQASAAH